MNKSQAVKDYIKAVVVFRRSRGATAVSRKDLVESVNREDERKDYGSNTFAGDITNEMLTEIASELGGRYEVVNNRGQLVFD